MGDLGEGAMSQKMGHGQDPPFKGQPRQAQWRKSTKNSDIIKKIPSDVSLVRQLYLEHQGLAKPQPAPKINLVPECDAIECEARRQILKERSCIVRKLSFPPPTHSKTPSDNDNGATNYFCSNSSSSSQDEFNFIGDMMSTCTPSSSTPLKTMKTPKNQLLMSHYILLLLGCSGKPFFRIDDVENLLGYHFDLDFEIKDWGYKTSEEFVRDHTTSYADTVTVKAVFGMPPEGCSFDRRFCTLEHYLVHLRPGGMDEFIREMIPDAEGGDNDKPNNERDGPNYGNLDLTKHMAITDRIENRGEFLEDGDSTVAICTSCFSPSKMFVVLKVEKKSLEVFQWYNVQRWQDHHWQPTTRKHMLKKNLHVMVLMNETDHIDAMPRKEWFRGIILSEQEERNAYHMRQIDYGGELVDKIQNIRLMPKALGKYQAQGIQCKLKLSMAFDKKLRLNDWSKLERRVFSELVNSTGKNGRIHCTFEYKEEDEQDGNELELDGDDDEIIDEQAEKVWMISNVKLLDKFTNEVICQDLARTFEENVKEERMKIKAEKKRTASAPAELNKDKVSLLLPTEPNVGSGSPIRHEIVRSRPEEDKPMTPECPETSDPDSGISITQTPEESETIETNPQKDLKDSSRSITPTDFFMKFKKTTPPPQTKPEMPMTSPHGALPDMRSITPTLQRQPELPMRSITPQSLMSIRFIPPPQEMPRSITPTPPQQVIRSITPNQKTQMPIRSTTPQSEMSMRSTMPQQENSRSITPTLTPLQRQPVPDLSMKSMIPPPRCPQSIHPKKVLVPNPVGLKGTFTPQNLTRPTTPKYVGNRSIPPQPNNAVRTITPQLQEQTPFRSITPITPLQSDVMRSNTQEPENSISSITHQPQIEIPLRSITPENSTRSIISNKMGSISIAPPQQNAILSGSVNPNPAEISTGSIILKSIKSTTSTIKDPLTPNPPRKERELNPFDLLDLEFQF